MSATNFTLKQKKFIENYAGNATKAAIDAGYSKKTARFIGQENLTKPNILRAIEQREKNEVKPHVAMRIDRQKFWSDVMSNPEVDMRNRLKASELLAKSEGDFTIKAEFQNTGPIIIKWADEPVDDNRVVRGNG